MEIIPKKAFYAVGIVAAVMLVALTIAIVYEGQQGYAPSGRRGFNLDLGHVQYYCTPSTPSGAISAFNCGLGHER